MLKFLLQASFEITVNENLIHSKLSTMAFPDHIEVVDIVKDAANGQSTRQVSKISYEDACYIM